MPAPSFSSPDRATRVGVVVLTIAVLAGVVATVTLRLRDGLRQQILRREASILTAVTTMQIGHAGDLPDAEVFAVLRTSTLRGVIALRVFDAQGQIQAALPLMWSEERPPAADWSELMAGGAIARMHMRQVQALVDELLIAPEAAAQVRSLFEAWVPLRKSDTAAVTGAAQFWIDGAALAGEFSALNHRLLVQASLAWLAGALLIGGVLVWAFRRLAAANDELRLRSENLQRANRELVLAAKTSALGNVTAHLIHALKNPLAGIETFVASRADSPAEGDGREELAEATALTRRLRTMVNDVVSVLQDEQAGTQFELSSGELAEIALAKIRPIADSCGVRVIVAVNDATQYPSRRASLAALSLYNLLQNAIEVSPRGGAVQLSARATGGGVEYTVTDEGPGLPPSVRERLFEPCTSTKRGGSGLGLALTQQLARQAGGRVDLVRSDAQGTCFRLVLDSAA